MNSVINKILAIFSALAALFFWAFRIGKNSQKSKDALDSLNSYATRDEVEQEISKYSKDKVDEELKKWSHTKK